MLLRSVVNSVPWVTWAKREMNPIPHQAAYCLSETSTQRENDLLNGIYNTFNCNLSQTCWKLWVLDQFTVCRSYKIIDNKLSRYPCRKTGLKIYSEKTWKCLLGICSTQFSVLWIANVYLKGRSPRGRCFGGFFAVSLYKTAIYFFGENETLRADFHSCVGSNVAIQPSCKSPETQRSASPVAIISA